MNAIRRSVHRLGHSLGLFLNWAFTSDPDGETASLSSRVQQQQTTIWALQARLNTLVRENRMLRAQLDDLHELAQFGRNAEHRHHHDAATTASGGPVSSQWHEPDSGPEQFYPCPPSHLPKA